MLESTNNAAIFCSLRTVAQVYKAKASDFEDTKASVLGDFIPAKLGMDEGESAIVYGGDQGLSAGICCSSLRTARLPKVNMERLRDQDEPPEAARRVQR